MYIVGHLKIIKKYKIIKENIRSSIHFQWLLSAIIVTQISFAALCSTYILKWGQICYFLYYSHLIQATKAISTLDFESSLLINFLLSLLAPVNSLHRGQSDLSKNMNHSHHSITENKPWLLITFIIKSKLLTIACRTYIQIFAQMSLFQKSLWLSYLK